MSLRLRSLAWLRWKLGASQPAQITRVKLSFAARTKNQDTDLERRLKELTINDDLTQSFPELAYYTASNKAGEKFPTQQARQIVYTMLLDLQTQWKEPAFLQKLCSRKGVTQNHLNSVYRDLVELLLTVASNHCDSKKKLAFVRLWQEPISKPPTIEAMNKMIFSQSHFDQNNFVAYLYYLIMVDTLRQTVGNQITELYVAADSLFNQLFNANSCKWPLRKREHLFALTAKFVVDLVTATDKSLRVIYLQQYLRAISDVRSAVIKKILIAIVISAVVFIGMMGLQMATVGGSPLLALSLVNLAATGATQIWSITTVISTALVGIASGWAISYSPYPTKEFGVLIAKASSFTYGRVNPMTTLFAGMQGATVSGSDANTGPVRLKRG